MIELRSLSKNFNNRVLFSDITFTFDKKISLITGDNGSGKSTLLKIIAGISRPTKGEVERNSDSIFYLPVNGGIYPDISLDRYSNMICDIFDINYDWFLSNLKLMEINSNSASRHMRTFSSGEIKSICLSLACAYSGFILLDEPEANLSNNKLECFKKLIEVSIIEPHRKFIMCTHRPELFEGTDISNIYLKNEFV